MPSIKQHTSSLDASLVIQGLHVRYGAAYALQGVDIEINSGTHAILGRNGMGKTTLCDAIMGLVPVTSGSITFAGKNILDLPTNARANSGIGYTPQGRRLWPSLTVDEHLRLCAVGKAWTIERIYDTFPRLAERKRNGGSQLSGGEQQMLAIARALLQDPKLLVLDEPTEGLSPVMVDHVEKVLQDLASEGNVTLLLVEQNIAVATAVAHDVAVMVNSRIVATIPSTKLIGDRNLQQRLLGVGKREDVDDAEFIIEQVASNETLPPTELTVTDSQEAVEEIKLNKSGYLPPTRWSPAKWQAEQPLITKPNPQPTATPLSYAKAMPKVSERALVYVAGTFDTKGKELGYLRDSLREKGLKALTADLSTTQYSSSADIAPHHIAAYHPQGSNAVFTNDRGQSVTQMAVAFTHWLASRTDIAGIISAGGSGGTSLVTPAMQKLPVGIPKVMISTVASGEVSKYVGSADIMMMYSVTDVQGLNHISRTVLGNGAAAIAGMVASNHRKLKTVDSKPSIGLSMFGVTTLAVQQISGLLEADFDCLVFHATGTGGRSMEKLADSGLFAGVLDITTTEVCDHLFGGVFAADDDRFGAFIRTKLPYVGSVGALDMVNFNARDTVPQQYAKRSFYEHNPNVTLMRTTPEENAKMGAWIAQRINLMEGPVRFLLPEKGVSALDQVGQPFHDPVANQALFDALKTEFQETANRRLIIVPHHINDLAFAQAAVNNFRQILPQSTRRKHYASI